jgi:hypothetical protein
MKMTALTETELCTVAGGSHKHAKLSIKLGPVSQSNSSTITQVVADADIGGDLTQAAVVSQSNSNSNSFSF